MIGLMHYLAVAAILFTLGVLGIFLPSGYAKTQIVHRPRVHLVQTLMRIPVARPAAGNQVVMDVQASLLQEFRTVRLNKDKVWINRLH